MTEPICIRDPGTSLTRDLFDVARHYLRGWRGITALATVAIVAGLAFNWSWLVATGVAPVLLSVLPCLAMCALSLCMTRMGRRSCSTGTSAPTPRDSGGDDNEQPKLPQERRLTDA